MFQHACIYILGSKRAELIEKYKRLQKERRHERGSGKGPAKSTLIPSRQAILLKVISHNY